LCLHEWFLFLYCFLSFLLVFRCWCTCSMYTAPWPINIPLVSCCKSAKSWCRTCSLAAVNMIVCEVE
jgi:hypothetical protein